MEEKLEFGSKEGLYIEFSPEIVGGDSYGITYGKAKLSFAETYVFGDGSEALEHSYWLFAIWVINSWEYLIQEETTPSFSAYMEKTEDWIDWDFVHNMKDSLGWGIFLKDTWLLRKGSIMIVTANGLQEELCFRQVMKTLESFCGFLVNRVKNCSTPLAYSKYIETWENRIKI